MNSLILLFSFLLLSSCGKSVKEAPEEEIQEEVLPDGTYSTFLLPVDSTISSHVSGEVKVAKYGDDFRVDVRLKDAPGGIHKQFLQTGTSCRAPGNKLLPFDDDLSAQLRGYAHFPSGNYHYKRSTSYYLMLSDLHLPDDSPNDELIKLLTWDLPLEKRVVAVYARTSSGDQMMACGLLTKISDTGNGGDTWSEPPRQPERDDDRVRPAPRPRPRPTPTPAPGPVVSDPDDGNDNRTWWDRLRQTWRRWRDRVRGREEHP